MSTSSLTRTPAWLLVAVGLAAGFGIAQGTGIRALGGAVFVVCGVGAAWIAARRRGPVVTAGLAALYVGAFVLAHVLALGAGFPAWFAVSLVTVAAAGATYGVVDRQRETVAAR
ncbi:hypothetical protein [Blastococcus sp. VKM Ac-2987]|uniref:hypothetical protein n=1 Tax=Blastococcus sp. VKM Ac-2987 TaxID=3004141 RepID=UPI0022ABA3F2|nr:hypothetical protein [Blastococcus sp. VKM Ac-2987]MCZ2857765.1 hypothetical protein [Blastococcus sp. VKM Ac-2987]